jgi:hypothetical protein
MNDIVCMARSFGTHFLFLTQNIATAVQDARMLAVLHTNVKWVFAMRGEPSDCAFLKPALPVTGRRVRPQADPFAEKTFYSITEERALALDEIANLRDRAGYLWFRGRSPEAFKIKTEELAIPQGGDLEMATRPLRRNPEVGMRYSRREYERLIAERDEEWREEKGTLGASLEEAYRRAHGVAP